MEKPYIIYNNRNTQSLLWLTSMSSWPLPVRKYDYYDVVGRSGQVVADLDTFEDARINVEFNVMNNPAITPAYLATLFSGVAGTLVMYDDPTVYAKVKAIEMPSVYRVRPWGRNYDTISMTFVCDPFRYKLSDDPVTVSSSGGTVTNGGNIYSQPRILVTCTGECSVTINGTQIDIDPGEGDTDSSCVIDTESMEVFDADGIHSAYGRITLSEFPVLDVGSNTVEWSGDVDSVTITRRVRDL